MGTQVKRHQLPLIFEPTNASGCEKIHRNAEPLAQLHAETFWSELLRCAIVTFLDHFWAKVSGWLATGNSQQKKVAGLLPHAATVGC